MDSDTEAMGWEDIENKAVTERPRTREEIEAMRFAWRVVKHVKSNAIVFATGDRTLGIGAGQSGACDAVHSPYRWVGLRARERLGLRLGHGPLRRLAPAGGARCNNHREAASRWQKPPRHDRERPAG